MGSWCLVALTPLLQGGMHRTPQIDLPCCLSNPVSFWSGAFSAKPNCISFVAINDLINDESVPERIYIKLSERRHHTM